VKEVLLNDVLILILKNNSSGRLIWCGHGD